MSNLLAFVSYTLAAMLFAGLTITVMTIKKEEPNRER